MSRGIVDSLIKASDFMSELGCPFAVIGGAAIVARARARLTEDVDLVVRYSPGDLDSVIAAVAGPT